ncbi:MAG TPA: NAD-dependent succinate-semialdehyde dehydrogenase [Candidatus Eisenbacteria bacterium]|nr:NAD-dependent succinate-semialdehyde dehydrogenase [Candidatus Eisenbacteria bacterium]
MQVIEPATGRMLRDVPTSSPAEAGARLERAAEAARAWAARPAAERAEIVGRAGALLRERREPLARLATEEMGKLLSAARAEVDKCAATCEWMAAHAPALLEPERVATEARATRVRFDPLGVVLAIMPWNFPFWQAVRAAAPALAAGNALALKHASNVPGCALALESLFRDAGAPQGVFTTLLVPSSAVAHLIVHPAVQAVTLTGSEAAGVDVAARAGGALKKTVLELGGSDPFLVLADADPAWAAEQAVKARLINSGQSCIAAKRFIVEAPVAAAFEAAMVERMRRVRVGDPTDDATELGPLAREDLLRDLHDQVERTVRAGATLGCGGARLPREGFWYAPTVLTAVAPGMAAFDEETFGPVAAVTRARDRDELVALANRSRYGLGASVWTSDPAAGQALAPRIEAGSVFVNEIVKSDPRLPFGGVKRSGYGRELSVFGLREFVNVKTVWVA